MFSALRQRIKPTNAVETEDGEINKKKTLKQYFSTVHRRDFGPQNTLQVFRLPPPSIGTNEIDPPPIKEDDEKNSLKEKE